MCCYEALLMPTLLAHFGTHGGHDLSCDPSQCSLPTQHCLCVKGKPVFLECQADLESPLAIKHNVNYCLFVELVSLPFPLLGRGYTQKKKKNCQMTCTTFFLGNTGSMLKG
jgi:hypothetical protein